ncbi:dimethylnonatriene synthase-like [Tasmannia lanceolata]|uniref:dimethylnonatriene synthase-like n=1 Tax=Tasmannia lanceolata TaxID=3420 RepID=UPI0040632DA7
MALATRFSVSNLFPILTTFDIQGIVREITKLSNYIDKIFESIIDRRRKMAREEGGDEKKKEGMHLLLQLTEDENRKTPFIVDTMKAIIQDLLVGGTNTTSTMVACSIGELLKHPDMMRKVQEELEQVGGKNNIVEESHLPKFHYLDAVMKESHHLNPAIPFLVPGSPSKTSVVG